MAINIDGWTIHISVNRLSIMETQMKQTYIGHKYRWMQMDYNFITQIKYTQMVRKHDGVNIEWP